MNGLQHAVFAAEREQHAMPAQTRSAQFRTFCQNFDHAAYLERLTGMGVRWIDAADPQFPSRLRSIYDPPPGLFVRGAGDVTVLAIPSVAIVGARSCSDYGAHVARTFARDLARAGVVVVSGLARGVDGWAHRGALEGGGVTVAVLGCGIDRTYPAAHTTLAASICDRGLIVSEYPPGVTSAPWRFPARNRIVAGLTAATLVVEARERSGALITADLALEEGREVLTVPGEITSPLSKGTNDLLRLGARPVFDVADVFEALQIEPPSLHAAGAPDNPVVAAVLAAVDAGAASADDVTRATGLSAGDVAGALVELELAGSLTVTDGVIRR